MGRWDSFQEIGVGFEIPAQDVFAERLGRPAIPRRSARDWRVTRPAVMGCPPCHMARATSG